jgi:enoyl-CoA hydratase/carnithine racemase
MAYDDYQALRISVDGGIARVTMDHPPINLLDITLIFELGRIGREVEADDSVRVVVPDSADREFFAAHADVTLIQALPTGDTSRHLELEWFRSMVDRFRTMSKATVAVIEGIARGVGGHHPRRQWHPTPASPGRPREGTRDRVGERRHRCRDRRPLGLCGPGTP